jgi:hypothetical protein
LNNDATRWVPHRPPLFFPRQITRQIDHDQEAERKVRITANVQLRP